MNPTTANRGDKGGQPAPANPPTADPLVIGTLCGVVSALGYTAANICLRQVATDCDPVWVSTIKAVPVAAVASTMVALQIKRGGKVMPPRRDVLLLVLSAVFMQLAGNVAFQWALGEVGLAVAAPLSFGSMLLGAAVLGRALLLEPITPRSAASMLVLIASIALLSFAAEGLGAGSIPENATRALLLGGVAAACLSGVGYAAGSVVLRRTVAGGVGLSATLMLMSLTGVVGLGLLSVGRLGIAGIRQTEASDLLVMVGAGVLNAVAFYSLAKALQLLPVVQVNLLSASQVAMAAVAGVLFFGEPASTALVMGVLLTTVGLLIMKRRERAPVRSPEPADAAARQPDLRDATARVAWSAVTKESGSTGAIASSGPGGPIGR